MSLAGVSSPTFMTQRPTPRPCLGGGLPIMVVFFEGAHAAGPTQSVKEENHWSPPPMRWTSFTQPSLPHRATCGLATSFLMGDIQSTLLSQIQNPCPFLSERSAGLRATPSRSADVVPVDGMGGPRGRAPHPSPRRRVPLLRLLDRQVPPVPPRAPRVVLGVVPAAIPHRPRRFFPIEPSMSPESVGCLKMVLLSFFIHQMSGKVGKKVNQKWTQKLFREIKLRNEGGMRHYH